MRCLVKVDGLGYYGAEGKAAWVASRSEAKVFRTKKLADGVVKILRGNRIRNAKVEKCLGR